MAYPNQNQNYNSPQNQQFVEGMIVQRNGKTFQFKNNNWVELKKRSGAKSGYLDKTVESGDFKGDAMIWVNAWNYSKQRGLVTVSAFENVRSTRFENKQGELSVMLMFEVFYHRTGNKVLEIAQFKFNSGKAYLSKLNMIISTKAPNGGYFGQMKIK